MAQYLPHTKGEVCDGCEQRLKECHPFLGTWFRDMKEKYKSLHISCGYREKAEQDKAFKEGKSQLEWPNSKHNNTLSNGRPFSLAVDVFQIIDNKAVFNKTFLTTLNKDSSIEYDLRWGGDFKTLGDFCHFELRFNSEIKKT